MKRPPRLRLTSPQPLESEIQRSILAALRWQKGAVFWRQNVGAAQGPGRSYVRFGLGVGSADIVGIVQVQLHQGGGILLDGGAAIEIYTETMIGRFVGLEVKRPGEEATPAQARWLAEVRALGGYTAVVTSVAEALTAVDRARECET